MTTRARLRQESGFTTVELLTALAMLLVVLVAVLVTLDGFTANAGRQTRITDANDHVRKTMDRVVADLRQAATVEVAEPNDLVYTVVESGTQTRRERICLSSGGRLWRQSFLTTNAAATAMSSGNTCPTGAGTSSQIANLQSGNSATDPLFSYARTGTTVRSVGLTFSLQSGEARRPVSSTLRASTFVRAQAETAPPINAGDISTTCDDTGQPTLTLSSSVGALNVSYTDMDGNALGSTSAGSALELSSDGTIIANITGSSGIVSQLVKVLECP
jgi:type II secretory pathway pseudopilin PulG